MNRLNSLLKKAGELLDGQWESFSALDEWFKRERSIPDEIREEWKRIYQLQEFFRREHFQKIAEEISVGEESREALKAMGFVSDTLRFLEKGIPAPVDLMTHLAESLRADRGILVSCSEESSQARVLATTEGTETNLTTEGLQISRTVFREVLRSGKSVLIRNPLEDVAYSTQSSIVSGQLRSIMAAPIKGLKGILGILYFDCARAEKSFSPSDRICLEQVVPLVKCIFFARPLELPASAGKKGELFLDEERAMHGLIGRDPEYLSALTLLKKVAPTPAPVLLIGESGTGKELFARAIHALSTRKNRPFVPINCAAIPETLLESELFGHEKGAFTGADSLRIGKLERAGRGTLFLDEIGEMKPELQAKLLRFLQSGEIERVGGSVPLHLDVRVIAATHQDLARKVENGSFRQDLYFRLNVFQINLPPLRKRKSDIQPLASYFYRKYAALLDLRSVDIDAQVHGALENYEYPGNVRELENIVYRSLLLSEAGYVNLDCLPEGLRGGTIRDLQKNPFWHLIRDTSPDYEELCRRKEMMKEICRREIAYVERRFAEGLVAAAKGNVSKAAQMAGIDRGQFHRLLKPPD